MLRYSGADAIDSEPSEKTIGKSRTKFGENSVQAMIHSSLGSIKIMIGLPCDSYTMAIIIHTWISV